MSLVYLYGIARADAPAPPEELRGLEDSAVRVHPVGRVAAIVGDVPEDVYGDEALNARLDDLAWVGERGLAHERVLDWFAERGPVIPLSLFSIHTDVGRVEARIRADENALARLIDRLDGKREWGVKLWRRDDEAQTGVDRLSHSLQAIGKEIEEAPAGKRFLLERKRESLRAEELRTVSKRLAHELLAALRPIADGAVSVPLPSDVRGERTLLLHAAFLVGTDSFERFHRTVSEQAARSAGAGFEVELTGPWPAYHFSDPADE